jgi:uroporphyrinogen decarboxylase
MRPSTSSPYLRSVLAKLSRSHDSQIVPRTVFTKGGGLWLESLADCGADCVGLDWTVDIGDARKRVGHKVALQGNLDPGVLFASPETVRAEAGKVLAGYGAGNGHIFNLGHGVSQFTPPESVSTLVDAVHELSRPYHSVSAAPDEPGSRCTDVRYLRCSIIALSTPRLS